MSARRRLAVLVTGMLAAKSSVLAQIATEVWALHLSTASVDSIGRRLRRALSDPHLLPETCYAPARALPRRAPDQDEWPPITAASAEGGAAPEGRTPGGTTGTGTGPPTWLVVAVDESSKEDTIHLFRSSLCYRGAGVTLSWRVWEQNQPLPAGQYWAHVDAVLDETAQRLTTLLTASTRAPTDGVAAGSNGVAANGVAANGVAANGVAANGVAANGVAEAPGLSVLVTADRAFDIPPFLDRVTARSWHYVVRLKGNSDVCFRDRQGRTGPLRDRLRRFVSAPGQRWKTRGWLFKDAGWRSGSVLAVWAPGAREPLVVITDLPCRWAVLRLYDRRFWIEPTFRNDKRKGWHWEDSQVQGVAHHQVLLLAMAWASLVTVCLGADLAHTQLTDWTARRARSRSRTGSGARTGAGASAGAPHRSRRPQHARHSLFALGLRASRCWLYARATPPKGPLPWALPVLTAPAWNTHWLATQATFVLFGTPVRP